MKTLAISAVTVFGLLATTQVADAASYASSSKKQTVKMSRRTTAKLLSKFHRQPQRDLQF